MPMVEAELASELGLDLGSMSRPRPEPITIG